MIRTLSRLAAVALLAFCAAFVVRTYVLAPTGSKNQTVPAGQSLPTAIVRTADGEARPYTQYVDTSRLTALVIFSPTCASCQAEAGAWQDIASQFASRIVVVGIACTTDNGFPARLAKETGIRIPILLCDTEFPKRIGATGLPTIYVISRDLNVKFTEAGPDATVKLKTWLEQGRM